MSCRDLAVRLFGFVALGALLAPLAGAGEPVRAANADDAAAFEAIKRLGPGVNILGYDGLWEGAENAPFRVSDFALIREAGFGHVRVNFFGLKYMDADGRLDPLVLARLDKVVDLVARNGLRLVLDQHDNRLCQSSPDLCEAKLTAFWRQIAARYAGREPHMIYEILNEPGGAMSAAVWNRTLLAALQAIRAVDAERIVVVAALNAGRDDDIDQLTLPSDDRRLVVTLHYYRPMTFTHQGAPWSPAFAALHDVDWGSPQSRAEVVRDLTWARDWASERRRPIYLGEFGVYDKAPAAARAAWSAHIAGTADRFGWAWAYWQFDHDFALFNSATHSWNPSLLRVLMRRSQN